MSSNCILRPAAFNFKAAVAAAAAAAAFSPSPAPAPMPLDVVQGVKISVRMDNKIRRLPTEEIDGSEEVQKEIRLMPTEKTIDQGTKSGQVPHDLLSNFDWMSEDPSEQNHPKLKKNVNDNDSSMIIESEFQLESESQTAKNLKLNQKIESESESESETVYGQVTSLYQKLMAVDKKKVDGAGGVLLALAKYVDILQACGIPDESPWNPRAFGIEVDLIAFVNNIYANIDKVASMSIDKSKIKDEQMRKKLARRVSPVIWKLANVELAKNQSGKQKLPGIHSAISQNLSNRGLF